MEGDYKIVHFDKYCDSCKHNNMPESTEPCHECLNIPVNIDSHKPTKYEEKPKRTKQK